MNKSLAFLFASIREFFLGEYHWAKGRLCAVLFSWILWWGVLAHALGSGVDGLRYLIVPVGVILCIILLGGRYVQDIYNLWSYWTGLRYILASFLGLVYPRIKISHGKKELDSDALGLIEAIGGPGYLIVSEGNVVLLEHLQRPSGVCGTGTYFLSRFERIAAIVDLKEQQYDIKMTTATSKDGIPVSVQNVYFHYCLLTGRNRVPTIENPYPYSVQAVKDYAYNRSVTKDGLTPWETAVKLAIDSALSEYITEHSVDRITAPSLLEADPRYEMGLRVNSAGIRNRLKGIGTELKWFDIGSIATGEEVDTQRLKAWQAKWNAESTVIRAEGEADRIEYEGVGRLEMQSDLLKGILSSFGRLTVPDQRKNNIRKIVMARTAQLLESMTSLYRIPDGSLTGGPIRSAGNNRRKQDIEHGLPSEESES